MAISYREATISIENASKILADPVLREAVPSDKIQVLENFKTAAMEMGMEPDGFVRLTLAHGASISDGLRESTRVMQAYQRGECKEFVEDFQISTVGEPCG